MTITCHIDDFMDLDFVVNFEFHIELDGMVVFDSAWTVLRIVANEVVIPQPKINQQLAAEAIIDWLNDGGESYIYNLAERKANACC